METNDSALRKTFSVTLVDPSIVLVEFLAMVGQAESVRQAQLVRFEVEEIITKHSGGTFDALVVPFSGTRFLSEEAKGVYVNLMKHPQLGRLAVVVDNKILKLMTSVLAQFGGKLSGIKWFSSKVQALQWLRSRA